MLVDITVSDFMKGRYNLMIYVGIDIAQLNHFAAAISSEGEILIEPFKFTNDYDGFYLLLSKLAPLDQHSIIIGLESTAHYGDNLVRFLIGKGFKVCVLNPIQTSSMRKNNVRKTKTDKVDTFVVNTDDVVHTARSSSACFPLHSVHAFRKADQPFDLLNYPNSYWINHVNGHLCRLRPCH